MTHDYSFLGWLSHPFVPLRTTTHFILYCASSGVYNFVRFFYMICNTLVAHYYGATYDLFSLLLINFTSHSLHSNATQFRDTWRWSCHVLADSCDYQSICWQVRRQNQPRLYHSRFILHYGNVDGHTTLFYKSRAGVRVAWRNGSFRDVLLASHPSGCRERIS